MITLCLAWHGACITPGVVCCEENWTERPRPIGGGQDTSPCQSHTATLGEQTTASAAQEAKRPLVTFRLLADWPALGLGVFSVGAPQGKPPTSKESP